MLENGGEQVQQEKCFRPTLDVFVTKQVRVRP